MFQWYALKFCELKSGLYCPQDREANHARTHYVIFSAGGALCACDNDLLPEPEDRNGRHWMRVELGTILMKFAFEISVQLWSPL